MKIIKLNGRWSHLPVLVDDDVYRKYSVYKWHGRAAGGNPRNPHVIAYNSKLGALHKLILNTPKRMFVDHINRNPLDNRRCNLRPANTTENRRNSMVPTRKTGIKYRGVYFDPRQKLKPYTSYLRIFVGSFKTEKEAAIAWDKKAKELLGDFCVFNFPKNKPHEQNT